MTYKTMILFVNLSFFSSTIIAQNLSPGQYPVDSICVSKWCEQRYYPAQYWQYGAKNRRSSDQILHDWLAVFKKPDGFTQSGFLSIRFVINCKGEPCCFYAYEMDENYQETVFDEDIKSQLKAYIEKMGGWKIAEEEGKAKDYYYYLMFTIKNGDFKRVAP